MPQFYPDGPAAVSLNAIQESGGINTPPPEDFNTPGLQGSMQQLLSENLGRFVVADFLIGVSTIVRRAGIIYSVGSGVVVLYLEDYKAFQVCDIFSLKFATFFPPGNEPSLEQLLSGEISSGVLQPGGIGGVLRTDRDRASFSGASSSGNGFMNGNNSSGASYSSRNSSTPGCRTLGQLNAAESAPRLCRGANSARHAVFF